MAFSAFTECATTSTIKKRCTFFKGKSESRVMFTAFDHYCWQAPSWKHWVCSV